MSSEQIILQVDNLKTHFFTREGVVLAVDGVSFSVAKGEVLGLVGESGSGKSVTGFSLMGLIDPPGQIVGGKIIFGKEDLAQASENRLRELRGLKIAIIFQDPMMTLNPVLRIDTQMVEAILAHEKMPKKVAWQRACDVLGQAGIPSPEDRMKSYPHQFSGGMRQRVAIAIAMLNKPDLIIADEPTTALDVTIQAQILYETQRLCSETGTAMIWITHDLTVVAGLAKRLCVMYAGKIVEEGTTDQVLDSPMHPYTKGLIGSIPSHNRRGEPLTQIPGMTPSFLNLPSGCSFRDRCEHAVADCSETPEFKVHEKGHKVRCFRPYLYETVGSP